MEPVTVKSAQKPPRRSHAERRGESERGLVQAAIDVVAEEGVSAATFETIGRKAGYSRGLSAQKFGSKEGLIAAVISHLHDVREQMLNENRIDEMSGMEAVLAYNDLFLSQLTPNGSVTAYFKLLSAAIADATPQLAVFAQAHDRVGRRMAEMLGRGQAEGEVRADLDPDAAAMLIGSIQLGLSIQLMIDPKMDMEPIRRTILAALRASLKA